MARRRNLLVFVEVKARPTLDDAAYAVTDRQKQRIAGAAGDAEPIRLKSNRDMRFDAGRTWPAAGAVLRPPSRPPRSRCFRKPHPMPLNVAVMDPIERMDLRESTTHHGSAKARACAVHYTPDKMAQRDGKLSTSGRSKSATRLAIVPALRRTEARRTHNLRRDPSAAGPALRSRLHHLDAFARAYSSEGAGRQRSGPCAQRAGKNIRDGIR